MIQSFIKGIISAISAEYGSEYAKYKKPPEQGLKKGSFLVRCVTPVTVPKLGNRAEKSYTFHITYFPKDADNSEVECFEVGETLSGALQAIMVDGVAVHSKGELTSRVDEGVLQFTATYLVHAMRNNEPMEDMQYLDYETSAVE